MNNKYTNTILSLIILGAPTLAIASVETQFVNHYGSAVTVQSNASQPIISETVQANGVLTITTPDKGTGSNSWGDGHRIYALVTNHHGHEICPGNLKYGAREAGYAYTIATTGDCTSGPATPSVPEHSKPLIENVQSNVTMQPGQQYHLAATVIDPDQTGTLRVRVENTGSFPEVFAHELSNGSFEIRGSGHAPHVVATQNYHFEIIADNENGETTQTVTITVVPAQISVIPRTISAWLYDEFSSHPGGFAHEIEKWNTEAGQTQSQNSSDRNKITELYTYGSDMEIYKKNGNYTLETYYIPNVYKTAVGTGLSNYVGPANVMAYKKLLPDVPYYSPIIDGRVHPGIPNYDAEGFVVNEAYLKDFPDIGVDNAEHYGDLLAQQFCLDPNVKGPQVDVEPVDFTEANQVAFYNQLTKDLAGNNEHLPSCHNQNKFTSIFTFGSKMTTALNGPQSANVKKLFSKDNFMVIDSLYDLPAASPIKNKTPAIYKQEVLNELSDLHGAYMIHPFNFKLGVPASCSFHECEPGGTNNLPFLKASIEAVAQYNQEHPGFICGNPSFKGLALWAFNHDTGTNPVTPVLAPSHQVMEYMTGTGQYAGTGGASGIIGCPMND